MIKTSHSSKTTGSIKTMETKNSCLLSNNSHKLSPKQLEDEENYYSNDDEIFDQFEEQPNSIKEEEKIELCQYCKKPIEQMRCNCFDYFNNN